MFFIRFRPLKALNRHWMEGCLKNVSDIYNDALIIYHI